MIGLTLERLNQVLSYDPETGLFRNKEWRGGTARANEVCGCVSDAGYLRARIDGKYYLLHRLAWFLVHGSMPDQEIDHINGVRTDNRIENLRRATRQQNAYNTKPRSNSASPHKGVTFAAHANLWRARLHVNKRELHLGYFQTAAEAHEAYKRAASEFHGAFSRTE